MTGKSKAPAVRVKFVYDKDARFEECNGETRPLTEEEYAENAYRACPDHPRAGSKLLTKARKGHAQQVGCAECGRTDYAAIPYEEYLAYYGNPARHVYLGCVAERQCKCCESWEAGGASVWGIDFMDDSPEHNAIAIDEWMTPAEAKNLPGYAREMAEEMIAEAKVS